MGRKKLAHYRIVVADSASPRDGRFVETLGSYKPLTSPARPVVALARAADVIQTGARLSGTGRTPPTGRPEAELPSRPSVGGR